MALNREIFRILFLWVSEWIEKSLHFHCSTFNSAISVKIYSFEVFNSALLAKFEVQSANFNSVSYLCTTKKFIPLERTTTKLEWNLCWVVKSILLHENWSISSFQKLMIALFSKAIQWIVLSCIGSQLTSMDCSILYGLF